MDLCEPGIPLQYNHPEFQDALRRILKTCEEYYQSSKLIVMEVTLPHFSKVFKQLNKAKKM